MKQKIVIVTLALLGVSCHKATTIDGLVQDAHSGAPIPNANVSISLTLDKGMANSTSGEFRGTTDNNGRFFVESDAILDIGYPEIKAEGYGLVLYEYPEMHARTLNKPVFKLTPRDGVLKIRLENASGTTDSLFFSATNDCDYLYFHFAYAQEADPYPLLQGKDESHFAYFNTCRGKPAYLGWKFTGSNSAVLKDTLAIGLEDTTYYTFKY